METVRLAIIGGGVIGRRHANAISMLNNTKLAAICDPGPSGKQLAEDMGVPLHLNTRTIFTEENIDGVLSNLDAAIIITGHDEFKQLEISSFSKMKTPILIDTRGVIDPVIAKNNKLVFRGLGRG